MSSTKLTNDNEKLQTLDKIQKTAETSVSGVSSGVELDPDVANMLNLDQSLFDEYLIRNIKMRQSTPYYISFNSDSGKPDPYDVIKKDLKPGVTEKIYQEYYDNVITNDQCIIEYDFPLVSVKRILHVKQGGFSIRELCGVVARDFIDIYREQLWVPDATLQPKDLSVNTFFVFHEPITVPADPNLCVTRVTLGVEPRVILKLKDLTEQSKSKGSIKRMMKKITEIAQENALNAVQAPIIEVEPIMNPPLSLAALADSLPDEDEEEDELMTKIVNEVLPAVSESRPKKVNTNSVAENRLRLSEKIRGGASSNSGNGSSNESNRTSTESNQNESSESSSSDNIVVEDSPKKKKPAVKRSRASATKKTETKAPAKKRTKKDIAEESPVLVVPVVDSPVPVPVVVVATPSQAASGPVETQTVAPKKKAAAKRGAKKTE